jgi:hypothetical protein
MARVSNIDGGSPMKIRLIVPNCNRRVSPLVAYGRNIAEIAGGFTATQATGGWIDGSNLLIVEPVTVFDCHVNDKHHKGVECREAWCFRTLARKIATELRQECVYLEIDGEVEFVKG